MIKWYTSIEMQYGQEIPTTKLNMKWAIILLFSVKFRVQKLQKMPAFYWKKYLWNDKENFLTTPKPKNIYSHNALSFCTFELVIPAGAFSGKVNPPSDCGELLDLCHSIQVILGKDDKGTFPEKGEIQKLGCLCILWAKQFCQNSQSRQQKEKQTQQQS